MAAIRGSTHKLLAIAETTAGVLPATPAMQILPMVSFTPRGTINPIRSNAIRSHPFQDKILDGPRSWEFGAEWELGQAHDLLLETFLGAPFSANSAKFSDALKTLALESQAGGGSNLYDHFLGAFLNSLSISVSANENSPVSCTANGRAYTGSLDDAATVAGSEVAASTADPFTFINASLLLGGVNTKIVSGTINMERTVNPLMEIGDGDPSEYVPDLCTVTGTMTVAYRDGTQSALFENFTNTSQVYTFGNSGGAMSRVLSLPNTRFVSFGRGITTRGVRTQEINWEAEYHAGTSTVVTVTRDDTP